MVVASSWQTLSTSTQLLSKAILQAKAFLAAVDRCVSIKTYITYVCNKPKATLLSLSRAAPVSTETRVCSLTSSHLALPLPLPLPLCSPRRGSLSVHVPIIILARRNAPQAAIQQSVGHTWTDTQLAQTASTTTVTTTTAETALKPNHILAFFLIRFLFVYFPCVLRKFYVRVSITDPDRATHTHTLAIVHNYVCVRLDHSYNYCCACLPACLSCPLCLSAPLDDGFLSDTSYTIAKSA